MWFHVYGWREMLNTVWTLAQKFLTALVVSAVKSCHKYEVIIKARRRHSPLGL